MAEQLDENDPEKASLPSPSLPGPERGPQVQRRSSEAEETSFGLFKKFERQLIAYNFETRGIYRVAPNERHDLGTLDYTQVALFWFSINLAANNITLGMLGPVVFSLGFLDASLCAIFGMLIGCLPVAYIATFGPRSGNRSLIFARYSMGWWPAKIIVLLNIIVSLGYSLIDAVVAGQILSAISPNTNLSIVVGIIVVAVITWVVTTFGYSIVHYYARYAWVPQLFVFSILAGVAGPRFEVSSPTTGNSATRAGSRLSFFSICLSAAITYAGDGADYFVYYPETTPRRKIFLSTMIGLTTSFTFAFMLGIGLTSGIANVPSWSAAYSTSQGALIVEAYAPLGSFGSFCSVIMALGLIANMLPPTYSSGVDFQILGRPLARVPRVLWNSLGVVIYTVCALAGRNHLAQIFTNFLALMGYWVSIWIAITLEEQFIFRRRSGYDWTAWNKSKRLPIGIAALVAFLVGWAGAILCMAQVWYVGPIAGLIGDYGGDLGNYVAFSWAALVFPPLRYWELKRFSRNTIDGIATHVGEREGSATSRSEKNASESREGGSEYARVSPQFLDKSVPNTCNAAQTFPIEAVTWSKDPRWVIGSPAPRYLSQ